MGTHTINENLHLSAPNGYQHGCVIDQVEISQYRIAEILNKTISGDARLVLKKIPDESVDLIFFDPPYFLQLPVKHLTRWQVNTTVSGVNDEWDKFDSFEEYDTFLYEIFIELKRIMKPAATIWAIASYHNLFRMGKLMQDLGYWFLNDVVWVKPNPMPNWLRVRFTNATETLIWAVKSKDVRGYTFDKTRVRSFGVGQIGANVWVIPTCIGRERLKGENGQKIHSTQKPVELLRRIIITASKEGDVVFDPMAGVGTTGYVANALGRKYIMVEANPDYIRAIEERMQTPLPLEKLNDQIVDRYLDYLIQPEEKLEDENK